MSNDKWKRPNAYEHGVFSRTTIVPGEDPLEFEVLCSALVREWMPTGATEQDAVLSIAKAIWRKRRAQKFLEIQVQRNFTNPDHPSYEEALGLQSFIAALRDRPNVAFEELASLCLRADTIKYLTHKFPRSKFKSTPEWADAVINEIQSILLPKVDIENSPARDICLLMLSSSTFTDDFFDKELKLDERLDIMIDRAVKRLVQTKAMKQMLGQTGAERGEEQVRKIGVRKDANGREKIGR